MVAANKLAVCTYVLQNCPFDHPVLGPGTCVQNFCNGKPYGFGSCTVDFPGVPANCCTQADPAKCMAAFQTTQGYTVANDDCVLLEYAVHNCGVTDPNFNTEGYKKKAACLCYDNAGKYAPGPWDSAAATCVATGAESHPTIYSLLAANNSAAVGLCTNYAVSSAAMASSTMSVAATTTSSGNATLATATNTSNTSASSTAKSGSQGNTMSYLEIKWWAAGLGIFLPGLILGTL